MNYQDESFTVATPYLFPMGGVWKSAIGRRDAFQEIIEFTIKAENIDALVLPSSKGRYPPSVKLEAWLPGSDDNQNRVDLYFFFNPKPNNENQI
jgi:hypothetical protein